MVAEVWRMSCCWLPGHSPRGWCMMGCQETKQGRLQQSTCSRRLACWVVVR